MAKREDPKTLCVMTEMYYPEQTSTGYLLTMTSEGLAESFDTHVITGPATNFFSPVDSPKQEILNSVKIDRSRGTNFPKDGLFGRLLNIATRSVAMFMKALLVCKKGSLCLVVTNPPLLPFLT
ncbi:MAG: hypothetical protein QGI45_08115, partial [Myxococcota bacterium]|nr:hypothetical protein [Myxococcota bacterium]